MKFSHKVGIPLAAFALIAAGAASTVAFQSHAQTATTDTSTTTATTQQAAATPGATTTPQDPSKGGHIGKNGTKEQLLTGDSATKATAAAQAAVSGGTIQRIENDADGVGVYEAHMTKSDGSQVTVYLDANYNVTSTQAGGPGGRGQAQ